jgi:hypothetical protein
MQKGKQSQTFTSFSKIRGEEHMRVNMAIKDATWYSAGLGNWSTLEGGGFGNLSDFKK